MPKQKEDKHQLTKRGETSSKIKNKKPRDDEDKDNTIVDVRWFGYQNEKHRSLVKLVEKC